MCLTSVSGYRPLINPLPSLGILLLDISLCSISFQCRFLFLLFLGLGLGSVIGFRLRVRDRQPKTYLTGGAAGTRAQWTFPSARRL